MWVPGRRARGVLSRVGKGKVPGLRTIRAAARRTRRRGISPRRVRAIPPQSLTTVVSERVTVPGVASPDRRSSRRSIPRVAEWRAGSPIGATMPLRVRASGSSLRTVAAMSTSAGLLAGIGAKKMPAIARANRCARKKPPRRRHADLAALASRRRTRDERAARPTRRLVALAEVLRRGSTARVASNVRASRLVPRVRSLARAGWIFPWIPNAGPGGWRRRSS